MRGAEQYLGSDQPNKEQRYSAPKKDSLLSEGTARNRPSRPTQPSPPACMRFRQESPQQIASLRAPSHRERDKNVVVIS